MIHLKEGGRFHLSSYSFIKVKRISKRFIGIPKYQEPLSARHPTDSTYSKPSLSSHVLHLVQTNAVIGLGCTYLGDVLMDEVCYNCIDVPEVI